MTTYTEDWHQQEAVIWFRNQFSLINSDPYFLILSIPNDGKSAREQKRKFDTGLMAGASDLLIVFPDKKVLWVEMKTPTGTQSPDQKKFESRLQRLGHDYIVCYGFEEFKEKVMMYIKTIYVNNYTNSQ